MPQAYILQPRSEKRPFRNIFSDKQRKWINRYRKRIHLDMEDMSTSNFGGLETTDDVSMRATYEVRRKVRYISEIRPNDFVFRLASYNILAQHQIEKNSHLYDHCTDDVLYWEKREKTLCEEMKSFACDLMCLQEVQVDHYEESLKPFFESLGFESHFKNKTRNGHDGVAIVFRSSKFKLLDVELIGFLRQNSPVLRADNVGVLMLLQPISSCSSNALPPICVANTHLYFNANRGDVKLAQLSVLLASIEKMARRGHPQAGYHSVLLCGDFNSEPTSPLFRFLVSGRLPDLLALKRSEISDQNLSAFWGEPTDKRLSSGDLPPAGVSLNCRFTVETNETENHSDIDDECEEGELKEKSIELTHPFDFATVYPPPVGTDRSERRVTSFTAHDVCCVDHIFYTPASLRLVMYCDTVRKSEFIRVAGIPNVVHASDHIPLLVDFAIRTKEEEDVEDTQGSKDLTHRL